jgi:hypothetical protein
MRGTLLILQAGGRRTVREIGDVLDLAVLKKAIDGGFLEVVPGFDSIEQDGKKHRCVAFCDEDGKRKQLPLNAKATMLWHRALPPPGLLTGSGVVIDTLVGDIAVVWGDDEWMEKL